MYITVPSNIFDIFFNGMISLAWIVVNFYIIAVEFRFLLNWFLNVNPFYELFYLYGYGRTRFSASGGLFIQKYSVGSLLL